MGTSGPGALNLVTAIADAKLDSIPMVVLTGQVGTSVIGTDAFQETPMVEVCRGITKHHYLVTDANDIARVMKEAFHIATTGRPGPVLVDLPKNIQLAQIVPNYEAEMNLPGYKPEQRKAAPAEQIQQVVGIHETVAGNVFGAFIYAIKCAGPVVYGRGRIEIQCVRIGTTRNSNLENTGAIVVVCLGIKVQCLGVGAARIKA
jgi:glyoxylate carboligase